MKRQVLTILSAIALAAAANVAQAGGDAAAGAAKAATCAGCHGPKGISVGPLFPNLAGQKEAYLVKQLKAFKSGARKDPTMSAMAAPLSDTDIANLAAHFSSLKR
jgi:cytochrome c553